MLKKILQSLLGSQSRRYSSSDHKRRFTRHSSSDHERHYKRHSSSDHSGSRRHSEHHGHEYYTKKRKSHRSYSS